MTRQPRAPVGRCFKETSVAADPGAGAAAGGERLSGTPGARGRVGPTIRTPGETPKRGNAKPHLLPVRRNLQEIDPFLVSRDPLGPPTEL